MTRNVTQMMTGSCLDTRNAGTLASATKTYWWSEHAGKWRE